MHKEQIMAGSFIHYLRTFILLIPFIPTLALASKGTDDAARSTGGMSIFLWFAAVNVLIIASAAFIKYALKSKPRKEARKKQPDRVTSFTIKNDTNEIGYLFDRVREFGEDHRLPVKTIFDLCLVAEELLSYVISNGFDEGERASLQLRVGIEKEQARIAVEYRGRVLNPLEAPRIDINLPIEDLPLEGWDVHLLRQLGDDIGYERAGDKNIITVVKKWEIADESAQR